MHHKPKTIFFTLKNYTYWKPIRKGLCEKVPFLFLYPSLLSFAEVNCFCLFCIAKNRNDNEQICSYRSRRNRQPFWLNPAETVRTAQWRARTHALRPCISHLRPDSGNYRSAAQRIPDIMERHLQAARVHRTPSHCHRR